MKSHDLIPDLKDAILLQRMPVGVKRERKGEVLDREQNPQRGNKGDVDSKTT
jgi:hypothetical protein